MGKVAQLRDSIASAAPIGPVRALPPPLRWLPMRGAPQNGTPLLLRTGWVARVGFFSDVYGWVAPPRSGTPLELVTPSAFSRLPVEWKPMSSAPRDRAVLLRDGLLGAIVGQRVGDGYESLPNSAGVVEDLTPSGWAPLPEDRDTERAAA